MHLVIDTFNVLHAWGSGPDLGGYAEIQVFSGLISRSRYGGSKVSIVCDGSALPGPLPALPPEMTLHFAGGGLEADPVIEHLIASDHAPRRLTVVSSDRRLQRAANRRRARWLPSHCFLSQILRDAQSTKPLPDRPDFARAVPLSQSRIEFWLDEFDISADFAGPGARSANEGFNGTPKQHRKPVPSRNSGDHPSPFGTNRSNLDADPLLRQALEHWQGRIDLEDLDMSRWLVQDQNES